MNTVFDEEILGHHGMRDLLLTVFSDADLSYTLPGDNPSLGAVLVEMGHVEGVYTSSWQTGVLDWSARPLPDPPSMTIAALRTWFADQDSAMKRMLDAFSDEELHTPAIRRADDFVVSPFVQHEIYREAVYIFYGKLSVYLRALERDAGPQWAAWVG